MEPRGALTLEAELAADLERGAAALIQTLASMEPQTPGQAADLAGLLRRVEVAVADRRRQVTEWAREQTDGDALPAGVLYELVDAGKWEPEYDDEALLTLLGGDPVNGLLAAWTEQLLRLDWRWQQLDRYCRQQGLGLLVRTAAQQQAAEELADQRRPHVLRRWAPRLSPRPVAGEE
jgi:hypothetical protein